MFTRKADLRHVGQGHEIASFFALGTIGRTFRLKMDLRPHFFAQYETIYGHAHTHLDLEITTCRLNASGPKPQIALPEVAPGPDPSRSPQKSHRSRLFHGI